MWPPGTKCDVELPSGRHLVSTYVPWFGLLMSLAAATLVWIVLENPRRRRPAADAADARSA